MSSEKYVFNKLEWIFDCPVDKYQEDHINNNLYVNGPYCPRCHQLMVHSGEFIRDDPFVMEKPDIKHKIFCPHCEFFIMSKSRNTENLKWQAHSAYHAKALGLLKTISLDLPPTKLKAADSDGKYFLKVELTQREGRLVGVVYIGEKLGKQTEKDKTQLFIDLDQQQVRFDSNNQYPGKLLSRFECEFNDIKTEVEFKKIQIKEETKK